MNQYREITKLLRANVGARRLSDVVDDFVEMAALGARSAVEKAKRTRCEAQYLRTAGHYSREQLTRFAHALALLALDMAAEPTDILGRLYMELDLDNDDLGQFFSPYDIARLGTAMTIDATALDVDRHGFVEFDEPTCGGGAFIIAVTQELKEAGLDYQTQLHVTASDISAHAVHMTYLQLALLHVPAIVYQRNVLTLETVDAWCTPAHVLDGWGRKLRRAHGTPCRAATPH